MSGDDRGIGKAERALIATIAVVTVAIGILASTFIAAKFDDGYNVPKDYWDKLLAIVGASALPIVAMVVLVIRAGLIEPRLRATPWGQGIVVGAGAAFAVAVTVIMICIYYSTVTAAAAPQPINPNDLSVWLATLGAGITLAGGAVSVAVTALNTIDDV